jgi:hypothetical protein
LAAALLAASAQAASLIPNGSLEKSSGEWPDGWPRHEHAAYLSEDGNHFLRQTAAGPDKMVMFYQSLRLPKDAEAFKLSFRVRCEGVKVGKEKWHDARVIIDFKDAAGNKLPGGPGHPSFKGTSKGWETRTLGLVVPSDAATLEIMPTLFNASAGTLDIDDIELVPIAAEDAGFVTYKLSEPMPVPQACESAELAVKGNRLVAKADGREVWLQGVAIASLEWSAGGDNILKSVTNALTEWRANVIRLAVGTDFWFGRGPWQNDGGVKYRALVDEAVKQIQERGAWVVIDLHEYRAPQQKHADFWRDVATRYANHPGVIFGLLNEPHDVSWAVWRDGGVVEDKVKPKAGVHAENREAIKRFSSIGMQKLVDVVRKTGARNLVTAGGLDWGYDLSGVLEGFALTERGGNGIIYESHVYPWKRGWQKCFVDAAAKHPLLLGEVGCQPERMPFIPPEAHELPETWAPDMLGCIQKHKLNWTAWCFHPKASPCLLSDWNYAPTPYWGVPAKAALAGKPFEMKKMR